MFGDLVQIQHALSSLCSHLLAGLPQRERLLRLGLRTYDRPTSSETVPTGPGACIELKVPDCGLKAVEWEELFSNTRRDPGMNLTTARKILLDHGALLHIAYEEPQEGCCRVLIPFCGERKVELGATTPPSDANLISVWIVDEERFISHLASLSLVRSGYKVRILRSPDECIQLLNTQEEACSVLLLGARITESNPTHLVGKARLIRPGLPVVTMRSSESQSPQAGCVPLQEPFTSADLSRAIAEALGQNPSHPLPGAAS